MSLSEGTDGGGGTRSVGRYVGNLAASEKEVGQLCGIASAAEIRNDVISGTGTAQCRNE